MNHATQSLNLPTVDNKAAAFFLLGESHLIDRAGSRMREGSCGEGTCGGEGKEEPHKRKKGC